MCRLFGMTGGSRPLRATFWLLEAPDSLAQQSRRNPDGYGIATYDADGSARIDKRPAAAYDDEQFAREAKELESPTFLAHVRYASTGAVAAENTHPFEQSNRVFAHNGYIGELQTLESRLGSYTGLVKGDTDSERFFALITSEIEARDGDVGAGIAAAVQWVARELPVYSLNCVLATPSELWALRYPDTHRLMVLERAVGGPTGERHLDAASRAGTVRVRSAELGARAAVIFASEQMDEDPGWRMLQPGELVSVDRELRLSSRIAIAAPPVHRVRLEDLDPRAAHSQHDYEPSST
jgi:predicted glutamine amidotransferase